MYYVVYGLLYLLSLLPLTVLYVVSDFFYVMIYHVAGYRKRVVAYNLSIAFPEKTETERKKIARKFYRNFTDNFIETLKLISASPAFLREHFKGDMSLFNQLYEQGKTCQAHLGHNFNWEIANMAFACDTPYTLLSVYMPINNQMMDRLFRKLRSKTGAVLLPATTMRTAMLPWRDKQYLLALIADQNPGIPSKAYWLYFFGRPTPFVTGPEKGARANDTAVVFVHFTKTRRGFYHFHTELGTLNAASMTEGELTRNYIVYLEKVIRANPDMWLWSHRRWKHEWTPEYGPIIG